MTTNITLMRGYLIVTIQDEINQEKLLNIRKDVLESIQKNEIRGVIFDMSSVRVLNTFEFNDFVKIAKMNLLLGAESIFIGLRPGVVSALVDIEADILSIRTFLNLESGLNYFNDLYNINEEIDDSDVEESDGIEKNNELEEEPK